jgi:PAS domain-containing protein
MSNDQNVRPVVDGMPGLISTTNAAGATEFVNQKLLEYFGKTPETLNSWTLFDAVHPEDRPQTAAAWRHSLETGDPYDLEQRFCDAQNFCKEGDQDESDRENRNQTDARAAGAKRSLGRTRSQ